ncbi:heme ABC exporter ATP-binding protein CcmA [Stappia taiwanensis]|uniref:Heme ABC exporter ATP-binding protein CcmA n=1 Tax=Stappia taiwanensis TaxID=992267 RepID=A0A838XR41_9HYPH|nr:heme ABC exporter ATP-binding protein CcmA [Stappia taiwanensis]MBA4612935.1 heme ABC exporter ATP-binding protein CcmA [Stappia taiwanensis]GGF06669.1 cytochrome c biogenesis ATP-binding export protein CcmA [Stappia taiwanensis]
MRLVADTLACDRGGRRVFSDLSLSLASGHALVVRGPNGVGKSSLLRVIAGLVQPAAGQLAVENGLPEHSVGEHCHYFGHQDALKPAMTVLENLTFWTRFVQPAPLPGEPASVTPEAALDHLGILHTAHLPAAYLSAGQRRRLSLARLMVTLRPIWLLDEPTSALDSASEATLTGLMRDHLAAGGMILAATHQDLDLPDVASLRLERAA